jgi:hypothetical protein
MWDLYIWSVPGKDWMQHVWLCKVGCNSMFDLLRTRWFQKFVCCEIFCFDSTPKDKFCLCSCLAPSIS